MNGQKRGFFGFPIMYKTFVPLDNFGFLWYHARVKLGCFATAPSDLTSRNDPFMSETYVCGNGARRRLFPPSGGVLACRSCLDCHTMSAVLCRRFRLLRKDFRLKMASLPRLREQVVRLPGTAGSWRTRRRGSERISASVVCLTAATYPEDTVLSRAVSRKSYQEEN